MKRSIMIGSFSKELRSGELDFVGVVQACARAGLDGIEIHDGAIAELEDNTVRGALEEHGLELATYIIKTDFVTRDQGLMRRAIDGVKQEMDRAVALGADKVMIVPGGVKPDLSDSEGRKAISRGLRACVAYGADTGLTVTHENYGSQWRFRGRTEHMIEFLVDAPGLKLTFDDGNFVLADEDPLTALERLYEHVVHVHLKDWKIVSDEQGKFPVAGRPGYAYVGCPVGEGVVPTQAILQQLRLRGYQGYISLEHGGGIPGMAGLESAAAWLEGVLRAS